MHSPKRTDNRVQEVSEITRSLKIMAKELNVPLMVCAQLARTTEKQANHKPGSVSYTHLVTASSAEMPEGMPT